VRQCRAQSVDQRLGRRRHAQSDAVELRPPPSGDGIALTLQPRLRRHPFEIGRQGRSRKKRHHQADRGASTQR
jgi:hypothetical protein